MTVQGRGFPFQHRSRLVRGIPGTNVRVKRIGYPLVAALTESNTDETEQSQGGQVPSLTHLRFIGTADGRCAVEHKA
jgi:hypothetical protein